MTAPAPPAVLVAIDPGTKQCAVARYHDGRLEAVYMALPMHTPTYTPDVVVVEKPQLDKRPPIHVIEIAWVGALVARSYRAPIWAYTPTQWKGSTPKPIHHARLWKVLDDAEKAVLPVDTGARIAAAVEKGALDAWRKSGVTYYGQSAGASVHNLLDAVALGAFHLGRLPK